MCTPMDSCPPTSDARHAGFLAILPRVERYAHVCFQHIPCPHRKADAIAEVIDLAWKWYVRLCERGKDVNEFAAAFVAYAVRAVRSGRRLVGMEKAKDVMSPVAQQRRGFKVTSLPTSTATSYENLFTTPHGQKLQDAFEERLQDNTQTPVPDQVAFRMDWPRYFSTLTGRDRQMAEFLSMGNSASTAASKFNVSPGRVTQLRQQWCREWRRFEDAEAVGSGAEAN